MLDIGQQVFVLGLGRGIITYVYTTYYEIEFDTKINGKRRYNVDPSIVEQERQP